MTEGKVTARAYYWCPNRHELTPEEHHDGKCPTCGWDRNNPNKKTNKEKPKVIATEVISKQEQEKEIQAEVNTPKVEVPRESAVQTIMDENAKNAKPEAQKAVAPIETQSTVKPEASGDEESLPVGTLYRILKPLFKGREKGFTKEFVPALSVYLVKHMKEISNNAMDAAQNDNRKCVTFNHLKIAGEKMGIEF